MRQTTFVPWVSFLDTLFLRLNSAKRLRTDLTEPIDVYTDWIDECEAVNAVEGAAEERKDDEQFIDEQEIAEG